MKEDRNRQEEALDVLLKAVQPPQAPDWFEARTLARLRREREQARPLLSPLLRYLGLASAFAVLALTLFYWIRPAAPMGRAVAEQAQNEQLFSALDAFESYTQQAREWNQEPY